MTIFKTAINPNRLYLPEAIDLTDKHIEIVISGNNDVVAIVDMFKEVNVIRKNDLLDMLIKHYEDCQTAVVYKRMRKGDVVTEYVVGNVKCWKNSDLIIVQDDEELNKE